MKKANILFFCLFFASCSPEDAPQNQAQNDIQDGPSEDGVELCQHTRINAEMIKIVDKKIGTFCIDRYEAYYLSGKLGDTVQNDDPTSMIGNESTTVKVGSRAKQTPLTNVSWYQAQAACANSGAHLCTQDEWEAACHGTGNGLYPYGHNFAEQRCNDPYYKVAHDDLSGTYNPLLATGTLTECQTATAIFDLSGNADEWVATAVPAMPDSQIRDHRLTRGGSYQSYDDKLQCVYPDSHQEPNYAAIDLGFRCCLKIAE